MLRLPALAGCLILMAQAADAGTLDRVRETLTIKLGYRADAKPHSYRNDKGEPAGYAVDLCKEVATAVIQTIGSAIKTEFVLVPAAQRFESVRDGKVDLLCDPSTITLARREMVDFSLPTFLDGASVLYRNTKPVQRYEDLAGKRVGVLGGTTTETTLRQSLADLRINATVVVCRLCMEAVAHSPQTSRNTAMTLISALESGPVLASSSRAMAAACGVLRMPGGEMR